MDNKKKFIDVLAEIPGAVVTEIDGKRSVQVPHEEFLKWKMRNVRDGNKELRKKKICKGIVGKKD